MKRFVAALLFFCFMGLSGSAAGAVADPAENRLDRGIRNDTVYAYMLIAQARQNRAEALALLKQAAAAAPDLPLVYFELARLSLSPSLAGIFDAVDYTLQGIGAYGRNFWWSFTLAGSIFFAVVFSLLLSLLVLCLIRLFPDLPLLAHDVGENPVRAIFLLIVIVLSILSPLFLLASLLVLLGMYMKRFDRAVVYAYLVLLAASPLAFKAASMFVHASSSGSLKAIIQVNEAEDNVYAASALKDRRDFPALYSYALAIKRQGHYADAIPLFESLLKLRQDPGVYVNLGNCYVGLNNMQEAARMYAEAVRLKPLASAYYNLSQVYREMLDFPKGEEFYRTAVSIDRAAVSRYRAAAGRSPNRMVADEPLSGKDIWGFARTQDPAVSALGTALVSPAVVSIVSLVLIAAFYITGSWMSLLAYRCRKCGAIMCDKCENRIMWGQMCPQCFSSLVRLEASDARERVSRILAIHEMQRRRRETIRLLSFLLPGAPFIYGGRLLPGIMMMWPFLFCAILPVTNLLFVPNSGLVPHSFFSLAGVAAAALIFIVVHLITRQRMVRGWL